jgi:hypothetical protein
MLAVVKISFTKVILSATIFSVSREVAKNDNDYTKAEKNKNRVCCKMKKIERRKSPFMV